MFDLDEIDIFNIADEGFTFNIKDSKDQPTEAKITLSAIFGKKGKDCRVKFEAKERELLKKYEFTGKKIDELKQKLEEKEPVDEDRVNALMEYEEAVEDAYIKMILVPLTKKVEGIVIGGVEFEMNNKSLFELYKKYKSVQHQAITEIYNADKLAKN